MLQGLKKVILFCRD